MGEFWTFDRHSPTWVRHCPAISVGEHLDIQSSRLAEALRRRLFKFSERLKLGVEGQRHGLPCVDARSELRIMPLQAVSL